MTARNTRGTRHNVLGAAIPTLLVLASLIGGVGAHAATLSNVVLTPPSINEGDSVTLSGDISGAGAEDTFTVVVDWGDGGPTTTVNLDVGVLSFGPLSHAYAAALTASSITDTITVTATDENGGSDSTTLPLTIYNVAPTVAITGAPPLSTVDTEIDLNSVVTDPGLGDAFSYQWYVNGGPYNDDGSGGTNPSYTIWLEGLGVYTVELYVTDAAGDTGYDSTLIVVPQAEIILPGSPYPEGSPITVTGDLAYVSEGGLYPFGFICCWTILKNGLAYTSGVSNGGVAQGGGGGPALPLDGVAPTSGFTFTPDDNGTYEIFLTIVDTYGSSSVAAPQTITVDNVAPTVSGQVTPGTINEGDAVTLSGKITDPGKLDSFTLSVNWGDGSPARNYQLPAGSTSFSVQHTYLDNPAGQPSGGVYNITAILTDKDGGSCFVAPNPITNGSFESNYTGWTLEKNTESGGTWGIAANGQTINYGDQTYDFASGQYITQDSDGLPETYYATDGNSLAYLLENNAGYYRMYQDVVVPSDATTLTWDMWWYNLATDFGDYQYIGVYILDTNDNYLQTLFETHPGDPLYIPMSSFSGDMTPFAGQTVRLSVEADIENYYCDIAFDNFVIHRSGASGSNLVNGDFDDGLTGWTVAPGGIADTVTNLGQVYPTSGSYFLIMDSGNGQQTTDTSSYSGLCGDGVVRPGTVGTVVSQTFDLPAGTTLSFQWDYLTSESQYSEYDFAIGELLDSGQNVVANLFEANSSVGSDASGSGYQRQSGWQNASFIVAAADTYTLLFVVTNTGDNEVNSGLAVDNIQAISAPPIPVVVNNVPPANVALSLNPAVINEGSATGLSGTFTDPGVLDTHTVLIDWGDGGATTSLDLPAGVLGFGPVVHTYADALNAPSITDTITVTVTDKDGDPGSATIGLTINNVPPTAAIVGAPASSPEGTAISLTATASDPGLIVPLELKADKALGQGAQMEPLTYSWTVSKNGVAGFATGTGTAFTFTPDDNGNYVVDLSVSDSAGAAGTDSKSIVVTNVAPVPAITVPANPTEGTALTLSSSVADPGAADVAAGFMYLWTVSANGVPVVTGSSSTLTFTPAAATYLVELSVTDKDGATGVATTTFTAANIGPQVTINGAPASSPEGTAISLTSTVVDPGLPMDAISYQWSVAKNGSPFGSGGTAAAFSFTPDDNGSYAVTLVVTDGNGATATASATIAVTNVPPKVVINNAPPRVPRGTFLFLTSTVTDPSPVDTAAGFSYSWTVTSNGNVSATSSAPSLSLVPAANGNYVVSLTVTDKDGGSSTAQATIICTPSAAGPVIVSGPTAVPSPATAGQAVSFSCAAQGTEPLTWGWDFGDGSADNSNNSSVTHVYAAPGTYLVTVTVKDAAGYTSSQTVVVTVIAAPPAPGSANELVLFLSGESQLPSPTPGAVPLGLSKLRIKVIFNSYKGNDIIQMNGKLNAAASLSLNGQLFALDIGGVLRKFTLDRRGNARNDLDRLNYNKRNGKFTLTLNRGNFAPTLASSGLTNADFTNVQRTVNVSLVFNQAVYQTPRQVIYNAWAGKFGLAR